MTYINDSSFLIIEPNFTVGSVVMHTKYHFRAVVVDVDAEFSAEEYVLNSFPDDDKPELNQPWYQLLIDDGEDLTYAPESMLSFDSSSEPVKHPMLKQFLRANVEEGRYVSSTPMN